MMRWARISLPAAFAAILMVSEVGPAAAQTEVLGEEIKSRVERPATASVSWARDIALAAGPLIRSFYAAHGYRPAWSSARNVSALLAAIESSEAHGLDPEDFHRSHLRTLIEETAGAEPGAAARADLDILLTDAAARLAYQHHFGKVDPADLDGRWNFERPLFRRDLVKAVGEALAGERVGALIAEFELSSPWYDALLGALARYRAIAKQGGWPTVPPGPTLEPGMTDRRIPALRARLAMTGDWMGGDLQSPRYDADLEQGVRRFQARHGLDVDGIIGPQAYEALNLPVEARIDQIRVNLERGRWVLRGLGEDFAVINIAGFMAYLVMEGRVVWEARSIVGRQYRKTPVFRDEISYVQFNPSWTVPPGILRKDILPGARRSASFIRKSGLTLIDRDGRRVDPGSVDWSRASARSFPYRVVQFPGPRNALGRVKFGFPNRYLVYMHDTPKRGLFARAERTFSSGCVRIDNPLDFAQCLLERQPGWSRERIDRVVATGKTRTVHLDRPLPVLLLYWTAWVDWDGQVNFRRDIYQRDGRVLAALNDVFRPKPLFRLVATRP